MKRLAIDTSARLCAACVYDVGEQSVLAAVTRDIGRGHAEVLMDVIGECLSDANTQYGDVSTLTVTTGPGSFTGVRVGLAAARGLALSLQIPLCGINNLDACAKFAQGKTSIKDLVTLLDAKRGEAYCRDIAGHHFVADYQVLADKFAANTITLCGSGAALFNSETGRSETIVHGEAVPPITFLASLDLMAGERPPEPLYLRPADAKPQSGFVLPRAKV